MHTVLKQPVFVIAVVFALCLSPFMTAVAQTIAAGSNINVSTLGSGTPAFQGGTLVVDKAGTYSNNFTLQGPTAANTVDAHGNAGTFSGIFSDAVSGTSGTLTITDSVGGGAVTFSGDNAYTGVTTINAGADLAVSASGSISTSSSVQVGGTLDISGATAVVQITSLAGTGTVVLGAQSLTIFNGSTAFSGAITGTGALTVSGGIQTLDGTNTYSGGTTISAGTLQLGNGGTTGSILGNIADNGALEFNRTDAITFGQIISGSGSVTQLGGTVTLTAPQTYTGATTISAGTLALSGSGGIAASQSVTVTGALDISASAGASIKSLFGSGTVALGAQTLTITNATGQFTGAISGTGGLVLSGGTEYLVGTNTYTGGTIITAGVLQLGNAGTIGTVLGNISNAGTLNLDYTGPVTFSQVISGTGALAILGGTVTITAPQTYTGLTTVSSGTLALSGNGSVAASRGVVANSTFDVTASNAGPSIVSLSGSGSVQLGSQTLSLTNASGTFSGAILGTGGLTLAGGAETLSGGNFYTGVTTVSSGTLLASSVGALANSSGVVDNAVLDISGAESQSNISTNVPVTSLSGTGVVIDGANTIQLTAAVDTFSGSISGIGGLAIAGGTETLTGSNSYTGTTTISAGTLLLSGNGSLSAKTTVAVSGVFDISAVAGGSATIGSLSGSGTVNLGGNTLNIANGSTSFSGAISGVGGLSISGGTQIISGANSYTGGTTITAGTLQLGNGGTVGSIVGGVADMGTLAFDYSVPTLFNGTITGLGQVNQAGVGTTILTATNSYTGGTIVSLGTLQIGNGGTAGAITGGVLDNDILAFDHSDAIVFSGVISGTGAVTQIGNGNLTLTGINTYTGTTTIGSGDTLTLGAGGSIVSSSSIVNNGLLDVSTATIPQISSLAGAGTVTLGAKTLVLTNAAGQFSGGISGTGGLTVTGGSQILSGSNSYTGATRVAGGSLAINGSITPSSSVTVDPGGALSGIGTTSAVTVNNGGTLAPGMSGAGTLTVNGAIMFANGSTLLINNSSASSPKLAVTGSAILGGTVAVASTDGTYLLGQQMTILTAGGGVTGSFAPATVPTSSSGAQFSSLLSYDSNNVYLEIKLAKLSPALPSGASLNQMNAVGGIDRAIAAGNSLPSQYESLGTFSSSSLGTAAQQLAGELGGDMPLADEALFNPFVNAIFDQLGDERQAGAISHGARAQDGVRVWAAGITGGGVVAGDVSDGSDKFSSNATGFVAGADWRLSSRLTLGGALSTGSTDFHLANSLGTGRAQALQAGLYGIVQFSPHIYGSFASVFAQDSITTDRIITIAGTDDVAASVKSHVYGGRYETGIALNWLTPYVAIEDRFISTPAYNEVASSGLGTFALGYAAHTGNTADVEAGFRQSKQFSLNRDWMLEFSDRLAWEHDAAGSLEAPATFVALPASQFTTYGGKLAKDSALISLGADLAGEYGLSFDVHFESAISARSQSYNGIAGVAFAW
jgi:fibronectin-binding autotransporter adhesin